MFAGEEYISSSVRTTVGAVLLSLTLAGVGLMLLLRPTPWADTAAAVESPAAALRSSGRLMLTREFLLLSVTFFYTGLQLRHTSTSSPDNSSPLGLTIPD